MATFQTLPGFREFYPDALTRRNHIFRLWRQTARAFGFEEYDAPVLEPLELYKTKSGDEIEAQLFSFTDKGGREVALRPEMTPTVCRLVGEKAATLKRPIKWFSIGEFYRYERAQKGRQRAFFQFNADMFGEPGPEAEIELIALLIQSFRAFGLTAEDFYVRLSDRNLWFFYLEALGFDEPRTHAVLGAIDKYEKLGDDAFKGYVEAHGALDSRLKDKILAFAQVRNFEHLEQLIEGAFKELARGQMGERLKNRLADWHKLLLGLDAMGLANFIQVDLGVVRGLAYYTGFVFEVFDRKGDLRALAGGGRYNDLTKKLGGPDLPAVGFAIGDVTTGILLEERGKMPAFINAPDVYVLISEEMNGRLLAFPIINELRAAGLRVDYPLKEVAFGKQFKLAADSGAKLALIYGGDERAKGVMKIRDLTERSEREVPRPEVVAAVREFFAGGA
jgi:histidyl-tRNA synthetase